ncbi:condensation domain-containing protein, partial [Immundisolibacter sp.]|uniref:condensation domain-containing protein n=1 Tax=Immundisolibacter sp. TaxID=1934948 RepID=UPI003564C730
MKVSEFISSLARQDIRLWVDGGNLRYSAPDGALTPAVLGQMRDLKTQIIEFLSGARGYSADAIRPVPRDKGGVLSLGQQRLWFLQQLDPHSGAYNIPGALRIRGPLHKEVLRRVFEQIVGRHEILRSLYKDHAGTPVLCFNDECHWAYAEESLRVIDAELRQARATEIAVRESATPFDLGQGPMLRVRLLELGDEDHVLLVTMHHIVADGWSVGVLIQELIILYAAFVAEQPSPLPPLAIQYADFAAWQHDHLRGARLEEQVSYWRQQLAGAPPLIQLPTDRPRPALQTFKGSSITFQLPASLGAQLGEFCGQQGITVFMALLAAYQLLLQRYSGQSDLTVGIPIAGRTRTELEALIGFFVNALVMRADLSGNPTVTELLSRTRETTLAAYAHQDVPVDILVDSLGVERSTSYGPLAQVGFALQDTAQMQGGVGDPQAFAGLGLEVLPFEVVGQTAKYDITLMAAPLSDGSLLGTLEYSTDLFERATVERFARHYRRVVEWMLAD